MLEQRLQALRFADRKASRLIERSGRGIERDRGIPEVAHQLHFAGVVPDIDRSSAARTQIAPHLGDGLRRMRNEIEDEAGHSNVDTGVGERQRFGFAGLETCASVARLLARLGDKAVGRIDADDADRVGACENCLRNAPVPQPTSSHRFLAGSASQSMNSRATSRLQRPT